MAALAGLALFGLLGPQARAQKITAPMDTGPAPAVAPGSNTGVLGNPAGVAPAAPAAPATLAPSYNPYTGTNSGGVGLNLYYPIGGAGGMLANYGAAYGPYIRNPYLGGRFRYPGLYDPVNGYLTGQAALLSSYGQYLMQIQQAKLERQSAISAAIDVRRKLFDEARYELMHRPDPEQIRQRNIERALDRARNNPPITEVWSARALNDLYQHVAAAQGVGEKGPNIPIDAEVLQHINLSSQATGANPGLLKTDGKLQWPLSLQGEEFKEARTKLERQLADAVQQIKFNNPVDPTALRDMKAYLGQLTETLNKSIDGMSPTEFIRADRFLRQIKNAITALEDPNAGKYLATNKPKNVAELVDFMAKKGLVFAPAVPGDESAYRALYNALRAFDAGLTK
jgi:hypothetical protein